MTKLIGLHALLCLMATAPLNTKAQNVAKHIFDIYGDSLHFLEYKPAGHNSPGNARKYPLIIFLHGIGERSNFSTGLNQLRNHGLAGVISNGHKMNFTWNGITDTFIVLSPMCRYSRGGPPIGVWPVDYMHSMINYARTNVKVDTNRVFLTGLSFGGGGTQRFLSLAAVNAATLAAAATVCPPYHFGLSDAPVPNFENNVRDANLPFRSYHANDDTVAIPGASISTVNRINGVWPVRPAPAVPAHLTLWPTGGHFIWNRVYDTNLNSGGYDGVITLYEWFLGQNKSWPVNVLPVALTAPNFSVYANPGTAVLDASASTDADGTLVRYVWKKISAPAGVNLNTINIASAFGTSARTTVSGLTTAGPYKFQLNVVDNRASIALDTLTITVSAGSGNVAPVAKAGKDVTITLPTDSVRLLETSYDHDGSIANRYWTKIGGPLNYAFSHQYVYTPLLYDLQAGTYQIRLQVRDDDNALAWDTLSVTVLPNPAGNMLPRARAGSDVSITLPVDSVRLLETSYDPDGTIASRYWTLISGPGTYTISNPYVYTPLIDNLQEGTYYFRLQVRDNDNAYAWDTIAITVNPEPGLLTGRSINTLSIEADKGTSTTSLSIHPNPVREQLTLSFTAPETGQVVIGLYDINGKLRRNERGDKRSVTFRKPIDVAELESGLYYLSATINGKKQVVKFIKE